jgi:hypothetical protein
VNIDGVQLHLGKFIIVKYAKTWHKQRVVFNYKAMKFCFFNFIVKYWTHHLCHACSHGCHVLV